MSLNVEMGRDAQSYNIIEHFLHLDQIGIKNLKRLDDSKIKQNNEEVMSSGYLFWF